MIKDLGQVAAIYLGTTEPVNHTLLWLDTNQKPSVYKAYDDNLGKWIAIASQSWVQDLIDNWIQNWPVEDELAQDDYILINRGGVNYKIEAQDMIANIIGKPLNFRNIVSSGTSLPSTANVKNGDLYILNVSGDIDADIACSPTNQVFQNRSIIFWNNGRWESLGRVQWKCDLSIERTAEQVTINSSLGSGIVIPSASTALAGILTAVYFTYLEQLSNGSVIPRGRSTGQAGHVHNYTDIEGHPTVIDAVGDIVNDLDPANPPSQKSVTEALYTKFDKAGGEITGITHITDATDAAKLGEGSFVTNGGASIYKNTWIGGLLDVVGATHLHNTLDVDGIAHMLNTAESTSNNTGSLIVDGGVGIAKNVNIGGNLDVDLNTALHGTLTVDLATLLKSTLDVTGLSNFNNTTDSTAYTNGAVVVDGGVGIAKRLNVHGAVDFDSTLNTDGAVTFNSTLDVDGATTLNNTLDVDGASVLHNTLKVEGITSITNTTASTDYNNGALVVTGGVGIQGALNTHGAVDFDSTLNVDGVTTISNTTDSTSASTGALVVKGGTGIAKQLRVGGATNLGSTLNVTGATTLNNTLHGVGAVTFDSTLNTAGAATFGSTVNITGVLNANNTTESTAYTNGGAVFDGGVGIAKRLNVHGAVDFDSTLIVGGATTLSSTLTVAGITNITNTTDATSTSTGAIHTAGGVGIAKQLRVGGNTTLGSNLTVGGNSTLAGDLTVNGATEVQDITIHGNVTQEGQSFITEAETVEVKDNILLLNRGETAAGVSKGISGIEVDRGTLPNFQFVFDESDDYFKAGEIGDLQILLLRDADANLTNNKFFYWDNTNKIAKTREMLIADISDLGATWDAQLKGAIYQKVFSLNNSNIGLYGYVSAEKIGPIYAPTTLSTSQYQVLTGSTGTAPVWGYPTLQSVISNRSTNLNFDTVSGPTVMYQRLDSFTSGSTNAPGTDSISGQSIGDGFTQTFIWSSQYAGQIAMDIDGTGIAYRSYNPETGGNRVNWKFLADTNWVNTSVNTKLQNYLPLSGGTMTSKIRLAPGTSGGLGFNSSEVSGSTFFWYEENGRGCIVGNSGHQLTLHSSTNSNLYHQIAGGTRYKIYDESNLFPRTISFNNINYDVKTTIAASQQQPFKFYAPTTAGTSGQYLKSTGGAPTWTNDLNGQIGGPTNYFNSPVAWLSGGAGAAYIVLTLPGKKTDNQMFSFDLRIYGAYQSTIINFTGYLYNSQATVYNFDAKSIVNTRTNLKCYSGYNSNGNGVIVIQSNDGAFSYYGIAVENCMLSYRASSAWGVKSNWALSVQSSAPTLTSGSVSSTVTLVRTTDYALTTDIPDTIAWSNISGKPSWIGSSKPSYSWSEITSKPSTFTPSSHTHPISEVTGRGTLTFTGAASGTYNGSGNLTIDIPSGGASSWDDITGKPSWIGSSKPTYSYSEISGTVPISDIPTGTSSSTVALGNHTHNTLYAVDDRDIQPSATGLSGSKAIRPYFRNCDDIISEYGMYADFLYFDTYSDNSGGKVNGLAMCKNSMRILHYQGTWNSSWTTAKPLAYLDDIPDTVSISISGGGVISNQYVSGLSYSNGVISVSKGTLPTVSLSALGITATATELNKLDGCTATTTELNILHGLKATTAELNKLDGVTATASELNLVDGATTKSVTINGSTTTFLNKTNSTAVSIYGPTSGGTSSQVLIGNGTSSAPVWQAKSTFLSGYATQTWVNQQIADINIPTGDFVTINTTQTITGSKTFTAYTVFSAGAGTATSSDRRLKENIREITYNKDFDKITAYRYSFKGRKEEKVGLIAQDLEKVLPEALIKDENGYYAIDTYPVISMLVTANKERVKERDELKEEIKSLKEEIRELREEINILKKIVRF